MGNLCFMCGLDFKTVTLKTRNTFDEKQRPIQVSACDYCWGQMMKGNHPMNQNPENTDANVSGFVKPSSPDTPPIRPQ